MATTASSVTIKQEPLDDWTDIAERSTTVAATSGTDTTIATTSLGISPPVTGEPPKATSVVGTAQRPGLTTMTSSGPCIEKTSPTPVARVVEKPTSRPMNFKLKISQDGGLRLASMGATNMPGTAGGSSISKSSSASAKPSDQVFFIRQNAQGIPQLCMTFKSDPNKLYVLQALAGQQLNLKINTAQKSASTGPFLKVVSKQGLGKDDQKHQQQVLPSKTTPILTRPKVAQRPVAVRSLLKPGCASSVSQTVRLTDSAQQQHQSGEAGHLAHLVKSTKESDRKYIKDSAVVRKRVKRKPEAVSLLLNAMKKFRASADNEASVDATPKAEESTVSPEATDSADEGEADFAFPFKIDSVFSLAGDAPQETNLWDEESEIKEAGQSDGTPVKIEAGCSYSQPYPLLTQDELLDLCGSSFVVIERLDTEDIEVLRQADQAASGHERSRCSDYCRKRTLNYLCMLNLIRCSPPKRRRVKIEPHDLETKPDVSECISSYEQSGLRSDQDMKNNAAHSSTESGTSASVEAKPKVITEAAKQMSSFPRSSTTAQDNTRTPSTAGCDRAHMQLNEGVFKGINYTLQPPFVSALSGNCDNDEPDSARSVSQMQAKRPLIAAQGGESLLLCNQSAEADTTARTNTGTVLCIKEQVTTDGASFVTHSTSLTSQGLANTSQTAAETPSKHPYCISEKAVEASEEASERSQSVSNSSRDDLNTTPEVLPTSDLQMPVVLPPQAQEVSGSAVTDSSSSDKMSPFQENQVSVAALAETSMVGSMSVSQLNTRLVPLPGSELLQNVISKPEIPSLGQQTSNAALTVTQSAAGCSTLAGAGAVTSLVASSTSAVANSRTIFPLLIASSAQEKTATSPPSFPSLSHTAGRANTAAANQLGVVSLFAANETASALVLPAGETSRGKSTASAFTSVSTMSSVTVLSTPINQTTTAAPFIAPPALGADQPSSAAAVVVEQGSRGDGAIVHGVAQAVQGNAQLPSYTFLVPPQAPGPPVMVLVPSNPGLNMPSIPISGCPAPTPHQLPPFQPAFNLAPPTGSAANNSQPFSPVSAAPGLAQTTLRTSKTLPNVSLPLTSSQTGQANGGSTNANQPASSASSSPVVVILSNTNTDAGTPGIVGTRNSRPRLPAVPPHLSTAATSLSTASKSSPSTLSQPTPPLSDSKFVTMVMTPDGKLKTISETGKPSPRSATVGPRTMSALRSVLLGPTRQQKPAAKCTLTTAVANAGIVTSILTSPNPRTFPFIPATPSSGGMQVPHSSLSLSTASPTAAQTLNSTSKALAAAEVLRAILGRDSGSSFLNATFTTTTSTTSRTAAPTPTTATIAQTAPSTASTSPISAEVIHAVRAPDGSLSFLDAPPPGAGQPAMSLKLILKSPTSASDGAPGKGSAPKAADEVVGTRVTAARKGGGAAEKEDKSKPKPNVVIVLPSAAHTATKAATYRVTSSSSSSRPSSDSPTPSQDCKSLTKVPAETNDGESKGKRERLERRYPIPPGVVIKTEPETFGYPTDPEEPADADDSSSHHGAEGVTPSTRQPALGPRTAERATADSERHAIPADLDCPDLALSEAVSDVGVYDDEPPVLRPVSPLPQTFRTQDDQQDEEYPVRESSSGGGGTQDIASPLVSGAYHAARNNDGTLSRPQSRSDLSSGLAETEFVSDDVIRSRVKKSKAKRKTRPSSASERRTSQYGSKRGEGGGEGGRGTDTFHTYACEMAPPALVPEYPFSTSPVVSSSSSSPVTTSASPSLSSNDRIRRLKEMLRQQNEQLEQIRRERAMQPPLVSFDD